LHERNGSNTAKDLNDFNNKRSEAIFITGNIYVVKTKRMSVDELLMSGCYNKLCG